jgi:F0F1-type ATP synthase membrane subunit c/vacuolar-type H+-ATPase subunit K
MMASDPSPPATFAATKRQSLILILISLPLGVSMFAGVAFGLRLGEGASTEAPLTEIWMVWTAVSLFLAFVIWQRLVRLHVPAAGFQGDPEPSSLNRLQTGLIICMAVVEGTALFGIIVYILGGGLLPAVASVAMIWTALFILWPRRGWYGLR